MKGFFNGTLELASFLIEYVVTKTSNNRNNATVKLNGNTNCNNHNNNNNNNEPNSMIYNDRNTLNSSNEDYNCEENSEENDKSTNFIDKEINLNYIDLFYIEMFIDGFRKFHRIYFKENKLDQIDSSFIIKRYKKREFPLNNKKLMKKIYHALGNNTRPKFYKNLFKICKKKSMNMSSDSEESSSCCGSDSTNNDSVYSFMLNSNNTSHQTNNTQETFYPEIDKKQETYKSEEKSSPSAINVAKQSSKNKSSVGILKINSNFVSNKKKFSCNNNQKTEEKLKNSDLICSLDELNSDSFTARQVYNGILDNRKTKKIKSNFIQRHREDTVNSDLIEHNTTSSFEQQIAQYNDKKIENISEIRLPLDKRNKIFSNNEKNTIYFNNINVNIFKFMHYKVTIFLIAKRLK
jgi:hypothetical protein